MQVKYKVLGWKLRIRMCRCLGIEWERKRVLECSGAGFRLGEESGGLMVGFWRVPRDDASRGGGDDLMNDQTWL